MDVRSCARSFLEEALGRRVSDFMDVGDFLSNYDRIEAYAKCRIEDLVARLQRGDNGPAQRNALDDWGIFLEDVRAMAARITPMPRSAAQLSPDEQEQERYRRFRVMVDHQARLARPSTLSRRSIDDLSLNGGHRNHNSSSSSSSPRRRQPSPRRDSPQRSRRSQSRERGR